MNIVQMYGHHGNSVLLEYAEGGDMFNAITSRGEPFAPEMVRQYADQILSGLVDLHGSGYAHMDIKPENLLLFDNEQSVKIADMGLARKIG